MKPTLSFSCGARASRGFSLIELMIALVLGLLVVGAAIGIFLSNRQVFRSTDNLSFVQENGRVAFELLARELRQAASSPCSASAPVVNVLNNTTAWGTDWGDGIRGYDGQASQALPSVVTGTAARERIAGTDAVELRSGAAGDVTVVEHKPNSAQFKVSTTAHGLVDGDIVMVCDFVQAAIFQITTANSSNVTIVHNTGTGTPGNCTKSLKYPRLVPCVANPSGYFYTYGPNSVIAKLKATAWYVGVSSSDPTRRSLYQVMLTRSGATPSSTVQEVAEGVQDMQLQYLSVGGVAYQDANAVGNWGEVTAVRVVLTMQSNERIEGSPVVRTIAHTVAIRNRNS